MECAELTFRTGDIEFLTGFQQGYTASSIVKLTQDSGTMIDFLALVPVDRPVTHLVSESQ